MVKISQLFFQWIGEYKQQEQQNDGGAGEEEEFKGADLDKVPLEKQYIPSLYEDENFDFKVVKPQLHGSHIVYNVVGVDKTGPWEGTRRYNQFFVLHEALSKRWPGMLIPKIPSKKAIGNKEVKFIYERKFYLGKRIFHYSIKTSF